MLGGVLFLVPLGVFIVVVVQVAAIMIIVAEPMAAWLPVDGVSGVLLANILAVLAVVLVCFLAGLLARHALAGKMVRKLETNLLTKIPGYMMIKSLLGGFDTSQAEQLVPVMVRSGAGERLGFEIQKLEDGRSMVYLPSVPNPFSGITTLYPASEITYVDVPVTTLIEITENFGHGVHQVTDSQKPD